MTKLVSRGEILVDLERRLRLSRVADDRIYRSRAHNPTEEDLRLGVVSVYAPGERSKRVTPKGGQFQMDVSLVIEIAFSSSCEKWDLLAGMLVDRVLDALYGDPVWLGLWQAVPEWEVKQFRDERGSVPSVGEMLTITVEPRAQQQFDIRNADLPIKSVHLGVDLVDHFDRVGDPDSASEKYPGGGPFTTGPEGRNEAEIIIQSEED
ncbi:hypothetical protein [Kiloniella laminariae]|uniref:hypothetical protein n=1 Tax=Kiloniella laminariae TaxID=454162 RepID=UPI00035C72C8|nr:hypothetical protein [Kiloniella laminariae]